MLAEQQREDSEQHRQLLLPCFCSFQPLPHNFFFVKHYKLFKHSTAYPSSAAYTVYQSNACRRVILLYGVLWAVLLWKVFVDSGELCSAACIGVGSG